MQQRSHRPAHESISHRPGRQSSRLPVRRTAILALSLLLILAAALTACSSTGSTTSQTTTTAGQTTATSAQTTVTSASGATTAPSIVGTSGTTAATAAQSGTPATTASGAMPIATSASGTTAPSATTAAPQPLPTGEPPSAAHPVIALTFDDGPSIRDTGKLLDLLKAEKVTATFFILGNQIDAGRKSLVQRAAAEGHEIGNHTYSHMTLRKLDPAIVREEFQKTGNLIAQVTGRQPTIARPPTGAYDDNTIAIAKELGMTLVNWSYQSCPEDWNHRGDPKYISDFVIKNAANGHIVLLHDTNASTMESMPAMIKGLKDRGFRFMTVSQLLAYGGAGEPAPGKVYFQLSMKK